MNRSAIKKMALAGLAMAVAGWNGIGACQTTEKKIQRIDPKALNRIIEYKEPHLLIHVVSYLECMDARIPGSLCLACNGGRKLEEVLSGRKDVKLIFYGGNTPVETECGLIEEAVRLGITRIYTLKGGLPAWRRAGYEIETIQRVTRAPGLSVKPRNLSDWLKQAKNPLVIDIRGGEAFHKGHLEGAWNIPLSVLHLRYQDIPLDRTLLVVDEDGSRAFLATSYLARKGLPNAVRLLGGMNAWASHERRAKAP